MIQQKNDMKACLLIYRTTQTILTFFEILPTESQKTKKILTL